MSSLETTFSFVSISESESPIMANREEEEEEESVVCNDISFDLLENILSRLDAKSVKKCECVCKSWLSLLRTQYFMNLHLNSQQLPRVIFINYREASNSHDLSICSLGNGLFSEISLNQLPYSAMDSSSDDDESCSLSFIGSDKGIIGISDSRDNKLSPLYYIWNPTTNESKKLPPLNLIEDEYYRLRGLGYDPLTNDLKVVVFTSRLKKGHKIAIYSMRSNSWKAITMSNLFPEFKSVRVTPSISTSINVNNFIHWYICYRNGNTSDEEDDPEIFTGIIAFDISKEKFNLVKLPQVEKGNNGGDIAKIFGCLSMIYVDEVTIVHVWVMKNYGDSDSWYEYLSFSLNDLILTKLGKFCRIRFLSDEILIVTLFLTGYICWYDSKSKTIQIISKRYPVIEFTTYVESVLRLNE
ncbi:hypothetical protein F8388_007665 [Cannabis sativa]|uniref:F-box domain-containing protein n=1 Tax=Cannabis sativa TaxID=3483 RepID=A0A7J6HJE9_CANSA|nr:hypothetical protein F8388_007665 [Cannabis sativa]KAF4395101.1 hypothetical protein G4B88_017971 [Cannabis sativa]